MIAPATTSAPAEIDYEDVDVAIVMESTYPYLKGGVSAVVHDIVTGNPDLTFGIVHITWDSNSPHEDLYGMPPNVKWVKPVYLSMDEHRDDFRRLRPRDLRMRRRAPGRAGDRLFDALAGDPGRRHGADVAALRRGHEPADPAVPALGAARHQGVHGGAVRAAARARPAADRHVLADAGVLLARRRRDGAEDCPKAKVYHAHTTGYAVPARRRRRPPERHGRSC